MISSQFRALWIIGGCAVAAGAFALAGLAVLAVRARSVAQRVEQLAANDLFGDFGRLATESRRLSTFADEAQLALERIGGSIARLQRAVDDAGRGFGPLVHGVRTILSAIRSLRSR